MGGTMRLADSHCHLDLLDLADYGKKDIAEILAAAKAQQVVYFLCVCVTLDVFPKMLESITPFPFVWASVGLHPNEKVTKEPSEAELIHLAEHKKVVGIGETGLDYFRSDDGFAGQQARFRTHIRVAKKLNKPLIVHSRAAKWDTLAILKEEEASTVGGVLHCFTEDLEMARAAMDMNFYISFSGIVTFGNAKELQQVAKEIPLERMLIETDSPWLAPVPFRGKPNQPAYVRQVADYIAALRGVDVAIIAEQTTHNFLSLFHLET